MEIVGVTETAVRQKANNGSFPKPAYNKNKIHKWEEREVVQWLKHFEGKILSLYARGYKIGSIAVKVGGGKARVTRIIEKHKAERSNIKRVELKDSFHLVLTISANIRSKLL